MSALVDPGRFPAACAREKVCCAPVHGTTSLRALRLGHAALVLAAAASLSSSARADEPPVTDHEIPKDLDRLILETGRAPVPPAEADLVRFQIHGEYQGRYQVQRSFPLVPTTTAINARPGLVEESIGQNQFASHWLRVTPRLQLKQAVEIVGQVDVVTGLLFGDKARDTWPDMAPRDQANGFSSIEPRSLYAVLHTPVGLFRVGQQPTHWGMGILANDGDHPTLFGDYRYGSINERILFATKPGGKDSHLTIAVAGDLVYRDNIAALRRGDHAYQGVLAALYERGRNQLGVYAVYRNQENDKTSGQAYAPYTESLEVGVLDASGRFATKLPSTDAFLFGSFEAAAIFGSTNILRTHDQVLDGARTLVRSYGGAAQIGFVHVERASKRLGFSDEGARQKDIVQYGDLVAAVEIGYARGDADPYDNVQKRFVFDPNHKIGLILFDEVMRWQTARASAAAQDPLLSNASRPPPGVDLLPSNGGVFGAQYINPTGIWRPRPWLDLKAGMVVAQATADVTDPYIIATTGSYLNSRKGSPKKRDLGLELDAGFEARVPLDYGFTATLGAQGGVLFPGGALENAVGERMKTPWLALGRFGFLF